MSTRAPSPSNTSSELCPISIDSEYHTITSDVPNGALENLAGTVSSVNGWAAAGPAAADAASRAAAVAATASRAPPRAPTRPPEPRPMRHPAAAPIKALATLKSPSRRPAA